MDVIKIKGALYTVHYDTEEDDEYSRLFHQWYDLNYLESFLYKNRKYLDSDYWTSLGYCSSDWDIVANEIIDEAGALENYIDELIDDGNLDLYFTSLDGDFKFLYEILPVKGYGKKTSPSFIRLYAIKLKDNAYVIIYGGIKLSDKIQTSPDLKDNVIPKIKKALAYFKQNGITESSDI
ncbi:MAG: hypothetical protein J6B30_05765 [Muribaculaceae bacterium]|nr:hypothetical protein [Muribaculaceae bacterium]